MVGLTVRIDPYPDLGHQLSTWVSGYLWAQDLGVPYLGGEVTKDTRGLFALTEMTAPAPGGRVVQRRLAATGFETEPWALPALQRVVDGAAGRSAQPWVGRLALDQRRWDQTPAAASLRRAVLGGYLGRELVTAESGSGYIAIHARRGDIGPQTHPDRWLGLSYYERLVAEIRTVRRFEQMPIRLYTSGDAADLRDLEGLGVRISDSGDRDHDFVAIAAARLIVAAPSSFGFFAALVSRAPVIARVPWWHRIPDTGRWFAYDSSSGLDTTRLARALSPEDE
ncbi:hypothetical protein DEJ25_11840 [Curtobacterium sp. MCPF17_011]|uniref:hypothetical protein n=1 Tax=Curtobacterium sp. MCPF17_011 TaxID=2175652 RepID=UPI000DAA7E35|nr:hypothetical protein [Curtobacterium sp. MCPF17_011]PZF11065.1 hypothetical protein DEJ25_11840 [Curtobacterium sp. MCPF17_011]